MRHHAVHSYLHQLANERMRLDARAGTDDHSTLDLDEGSDEDIIPKGAAVNVRGLHDGDVPACLHVDNPDPPQDWGTHAPIPRRQRTGLKRNGTSRPVSIDS